MSEHIPYVDFGGRGETVHFAHANGFPTKAYQQFINTLLPNHRVIGMSARPLWKNSDHTKFKTWETAADDLIRFLDQQGLSNIIGMGHSFGAICTAIAAKKRPDLFSKLVLIEPVILPKRIHLLIALMPIFLVKKFNPVVKRTLVRTDHWTAREKAFDQFRNKKVFAQLSDDALWDYVNSATEIAKDGAVFLKFSKEWEAQIYLTIHNSWQIFADLEHPFLVIRGETSDTIFEETWDKLQHVNSNGIFVQLDNTGHLVPLEKPEEVAVTISSFL